MKKKYIEGAKSGLLPVIFLYTLESVKDENFELKERFVMESLAFNNKKIDVLVEDRALITNFQEHDISN